MGVFKIVTVPATLGVFLGLVLFGGGHGIPTVANGFTASSDEEAIRGVIANSYFNGAFNDQDTKAMAKGFHEDFAIFSPQDDELSRYEIATWIAGIKERRAQANFDPKSTRMEGRIISLDVTGVAASAKIELYRGEQLIYTDYLSFLKFKSGWKIAAKVYHRHSG